MAGMLAHSWSACAPSPTAPRPSSVGIPTAALCVNIGGTVRYRNLRENPRATVVVDDLASMDPWSPEGDGRRLGEGERGAGEDDSSIGASIKALQKALRHATAAMTLDRYVGLLPEDVEAMRSEMAKAAQAHRAAASKSPAKKPKK